MGISSGHVPDFNPVEPKKRCYGSVAVAAQRFPGTFHAGFVLVACAAMVACSELVSDKWSCTSRLHQLCGCPGSSGPRFFSVFRCVCTRDLTPFGNLWLELSGSN